MSNLILTFSAIGSLGAFGAASYFFLKSTQPSLPNHSLVEKTLGSTFVKEPLSPSWMILKSGYKLKPGSLIRTSPQSELVVSNSNGLFLKLHERSAAMIGDFKSSASEIASISIHDGFIEVIRPKSADLSQMQQVKLKNGRIEFNLPLKPFYVFVKRDVNTLTFGSTNEPMLITGGDGQTTTANVGQPLELTEPESGKGILLSRSENVALARILETDLETRFADLMNSFSPSPSDPNIQLTLREYDELVIPTPTPPPAPTVQPTPIPTQLPAPQQVNAKQSPIDKNKAKISKPKTATKVVQKKLVDLKKKNKTNFPELPEFLPISLYEDDQNPDDGEAEEDEDDNAQEMELDEKTELEPEELPPPPQPKQTPTPSALKPKRKIPPPFGEYFVSPGKIEDSFEPFSLPSQEEKQTWLKASPSNIFIKGYLEQFSVKISSDFFSKKPQVKDILLWISGRLHSISIYLINRNPGLLKLLQSLNTVFIVDGTHIESIQGKISPTQKKSNWPQELNSQSEFQKAKTAVFIIDKLGKITFSSLNESGFISLPFFESFESLALVGLRQSDPAGFLSLNKSDEKLTVFHKALNASEKVDVLVAILEQENAEFTVKVAAMNSSESTLIRTFQIRDLSLIQPAFEKALAFDGIITSSMQGFMRIIHQSKEPKEGNYGIILPKSGSKIWLPKVSNIDTPIALIKCVSVTQDSCIAEIVASGTSNMKEIIGSKVKWF